jgi:hypothetical protein
VLSAINPNIEPSYWWLTALTLPLWGWAIWWNIDATLRGIVEGVKMRAATSVLSVIYLVANCVLLFSTVSPGAWSDVMRGFQLLTIPIVWVLPARMSVRMADKIRETDRRAIEKYDGELD